MDLKAYFHEPYQGGESFINNVILPIFGEDKYDDAYEEDVIDNNPELERMAESTGISQILRLGTIDIPMNPTDVFDITVNNRVQMERNRVAIQMLIRRIMSTYSSAFMVFHYNDTNKWDWRFSFCSKQGNNSETTDSKRYTFLLGPNQSCRTAAENFNKLAEKTGEIELDDIVKAFDVEVLSKEFFDKYKHHYECFCEYVYDNKDNTEYFGREFSKCEDKIIRDYVKKLLGRIVFLHFLQKKGWMGVPADKEWGEGDLNFMRNLFNNASQSQKENFLDKVLKPLFEKGLDTDRTANNDLFNTGVEGFKNVKIPYLNGGLFEKDALDKPKARFSAQLFDDLLEFFYEYNFTIDENDPNDAQVGVDPEMLGRIFENLLEDNKDKGAFYTPKEIVHYMCKESLIAYLQTDVKTEETKKAIRTFVTTYDVNAIGGKDSATAKDIDEYLKDVKICDPAIGSGAFPMGMLKELFFCRGAIENFNDAAEIKRHIIQQNIYGVDIEKGAVDIARLRFWLALIVDEKTPHALPNMDFKIMQGNSLLEQYKGVDLSRIMENKTVSFGAMQIPFLENDIDESRRQLIALRKEYFHTYDKERKKTLRKAMHEKVQQLIDLTTNNLGGKYNGKHSETIDLSDIDIASTSEFFLWHTWFCDVFENGGFDIVIGNPPYGAKYDNQTKKYYKKNYSTANSIKGIQKASLDTYTLFIELGYNLLRTNGNFAYIVPISLTSSDSLTGVHRILMENCDTIHISSYAVRPKPVFENAVVNTSILLFQKTGTPCRHLYSTKMHRRGNNFDLQKLIDNLQFVDVKGYTLYGRIPKIGSETEKIILNKLFKQTKLGSILQNSGSPIIYRFAGGRYFKVVTNYSNGSSAERTIYFDNKRIADAVGCILSSNLSFWFYQIFSDNLNWKNYEIENFTIPQLSNENIIFLDKLYFRYLKDIEAKANIRTTSGESAYNVDSFKEYKIVHSKAIIDEIDDYICPLYGLTQRETDFIKNYELEFRLAGE